MSVIIKDVLDGSYGQRAGVLPGDVIVKLEGERIGSYNGLQELLQYYAAGDTVEVTIMRQEKGEYVEHKLQVTLGKRPDNN